VRRAQGDGVTGPRVLVTGGLGFIGASLVKHLAAGDAHVTVLTPSAAIHGERAAGLASHGVEIVSGDVRDAALMRRLVTGIDVVYHLAGWSGAVRSLEDPFTDLDVNYRGTLVLLEAMRHARASGKIVFAGSRLHYGHAATLPVGEADAADPLSLHAIHKSAAESALHVYRRIFGIRTVVARIANPYGIGQPRERTAYGVINRLVHLAVNGGALQIFGDGRQLRDYVYVDDVTRALVAMGTSPRADGRIYNVGSGTGTALVDAARMIVAIAGSGRIEHVEWPELASRVETGDFIADIGRIGSELGWTPSVSLSDGLRQTVAFYQSRVNS
jgi:nucleoside-diphosphate-sugar epimerase